MKLCLNCGKKTKDGKKIQIFETCEECREGRSPTYIKHDSKKKKGGLSHYYLENKV